MVPWLASRDMVHFRNSTTCHNLHLLDPHVTVTLASWMALGAQGNRFYDYTCYSASRTAFHVIQPDGQGEFQIRAVFFDKGIPDS